MPARTFLETVLSDLRVAARMLLRAPAFALAVVLTLALAIGADTAIFTVVRSVLLKPLDFPDPGRLVRLSGGATVARYEAIRGARTLAGAAAFNVFTQNVVLAGPAGAEPLKAVRVSTNFLQVLGLLPAAGRGFLPGEEAPGQSPILISHDLWRRRFGGEPSVAGASVTLSAAPHTIAGVLPPGLDFPLPGVDVLMPLQPAAMPVQARVNSPVLAVFGRLAPGVALEHVRAELAVISRAYALANPGLLDAKPFQPDSVLPLRDYLVRGVRPSLWLLFSAVGFLLLIAGANIAGLLLARSASRSRELAVRAALGAGRVRLVRQLLAECLLLSICGAGLGVTFASWSLRALSALPGLDLPRLAEVRLDGGVLAFSLALTLSVCLLCGLGPALGASRPDLNAAMRGGSGASRLPRHLTLWLSPRGLLVAVQIALSVVLLCGAALLLQSLARLRRVDPGFHASNLLTMQIALSPALHATPAASARFFGELVRRVESIPGVRGAAVMLTLPMTGFAGTPVQLASRPALKLNERPIAILQSVTPGYFRTLGIPLRAGRDFDAGDGPEAQPVAVINEALARRFWPAYPSGESPLGRYLLAGANPQPLRIVGIAGDVRQAGLSLDAGEALYRPRSQTPSMAAMFAVRTENDPLRFVGAIRGRLAALDSNHAITSLRTMDEVVDASEGQRRSMLILLGLFAAAGLLLAAIGVYAMAACWVSGRAAELSVRAAVGASPAALLRLVLQQSLAVTLAGAALGLAGAAAVTRLLAALLYGVGATDPVTFAAVALLLILVALASAYVPARRAAAADPLATLRAG